MKVSSDIVGQKMKLFTTEITQRKINNYAAAVGDPNSYYLDDERKDGLIAPPTLAAAVTWPLIQNLEDYIDLGYPPEIMFRIVHYSEHLIINRPLKPTDRLSIEGEVTAVIPKKNGTHIVFKLPAFDQSGQPVFTEYIGGMLRDVECADQGQGANSLPSRPSSPANDKPVWEVATPISREDCYIYDGCADVPFPIHTSPAFAHSVGLPDIIYYGIGTLAKAVRELINREAGADPTGVQTLSCRFRGMVLPDSFIRIQLLQRTCESGLRGLHFKVINQEGREAISEGYMSLIK